MLQDLKGINCQANKYIILIFVKIYLLEVRNLIESISNSSQNEPWTKKLR